MARNSEQPLAIPPLTDAREVPTNRLRDQPAANKVVHSPRIRRPQYTCRSIGGPFCQPPIELLLRIVDENEQNTVCGADERHLARGHVRIARHGD
jgi:hypothetical protein